MKNLLGNKEDVKSPIAGQFSNSIFYIMIVGCIFGPLIVIAQLWVAKSFLDAEQSKQASDIVITMAKALVFSIGGGGPVALFLRSLKITDGKIAAQVKSTEPDVPNNKAPEPDLGIQEEITTEGTDAEVTSTEDAGFEGEGDIESSEIVEIIPAPPAKKTRVRKSGV